MTTFPGELREEPERFDEMSADLGSWREDQERLRAAEESAHARLERAAETISRPGVPSDSARAHAAGHFCADPRCDCTNPRDNPLMLGLTPSGFTRYCSSSAKLDAAALDGIADAVRYAATHERTINRDRFVALSRKTWKTISALIRSTGRSC